MPCDQTLPVIRLASTNRPSRKGNRNTFDIPRGSIHAFGELSRLSSDPSTVFILCTTHKPLRLYAKASKAGDQVAYSVFSGLAVVWMPQVGLLVLTLTTFVNIRVDIEAGSSAEIMLNTRLLWIFKYNKTCRISRAKYVLCLSDKYHRHIPFPSTLPSLYIYFLNVVSRIVGVISHPENSAVTLF